MFVVSGHLYRPLPLSQPCGLKVKIKDGFWDPLLKFLGAGLSILVFLWHLSPVGSAIWRGLRNRSDTYSFTLRASPNPFAHVLTLIYFGVGSRGERPPISLLNNDYKIVMRVWANKIGPILAKRIGHHQRGFIPTRDGRENIINVQLLINLINAKNEEGAIIFPGPGEGLQYGELHSHQPNI